MTDGKIRYLTALPVYNEAGHVTAVLDQVVRNAADVLVVDDGSADGTGELLAVRHDVTVVTHAQNRGYGAALKTAFDYAIDNDYDVLVTIDCDGQHEPQRIGALVAACRDADIVSGSRYLAVEGSEQNVPVDRRRINLQITEEINCRLGLKLTDAFCGFKAYRVEALKQLELTETGYAMPLELWVQAAFHGLRIVELPVPLVYLEEKRSFGGALDDCAEAARLLSRGDRPGSARLPRRGAGRRTVGLSLRRDVPRLRVSCVERYARYRAPAESGASSWRLPGANLAACWPTTAPGERRPRLRYRAGRLLIWPRRAGGNWSTALASTLPPTQEVLPRLQTLRTPRPR